LPADNGGSLEGGIARFVGTLDNARASDTSDVQLTLSSGDNYLPSAVFDTGFDDEALVSIGYDAIAIGNHEFDRGPDVFADFINDYKSGGGTAPWLAANLDFSGEANLQALVDSGDIARSVIVNKGGQRFGIIGADTENLPFITTLGNVTVTNRAGTVAAIQAEVDALKSAGVENIILISQMQGIDEEKDLISQVRGLDIVIAGGGDDLLQNPGVDDGTELLPGDTGGGDYPQNVADPDGRNVVLVATQGGYDYLGRLTVTFDDAGEVSAVDSSSGPIRILEGDPLVGVDAGAAQIETDVEAALAANPLVATSEVTLDAVTDNVRAVETNLGNLIADALLAGVEGRNDDNPSLDERLIAIQNGGGIRTNSTYDELTLNDVNSILPFGNTLSVVEDVSVQQLVNTLENAVSRVVWDEESGRPEREGDGTGRFAQVAGFRFEYRTWETPLELDGSGNVLVPGNRIVKVWLDDGTVLYENGIVLRPDIFLDIATLSFTAGGGDQYFFDFAQTITSLGDLDRDLLFNYLTNVLGGNVTAAMYPEGGAGRITGAPIPGVLSLMLFGLAGIAVRRRPRA
jgi:5'-nucleotidase